MLFFTPYPGDFTMAIHVPDPTFGKKICGQCISSGVLIAVFM